MKKPACLALAILLFLGCSKAAVKSETAIAEGSAETSRTLQIQTGQTVIEAAMQADSVVVYRTDTLTVAKYYAVRKTEAIRDTLTLVRADTLSRTDTVRIAAKTEEKPEPGGWEKFKNTIATVTTWLVLAFLSVCVWRWKKS